MVVMVFFAAVTGAVWRLQGDGYILFEKSHGLANVRLPWLIALMFRTHQLSAVLMSVDIGRDYPVIIQVRSPVFCDVVITTLHYLLNCID